MKKLKVLLFTSISLLLATIFGCSNGIPEENPDEKSNFTVTGYAKSDNAENHSGIIITLEQTDGLSGSKFAINRGARTVDDSYIKKTTTDESGKYEFKDVPKGIYTVYASANNTVEKVAILTNRSVNENVTLEALGLTATGNISGTITIDGGTDNVYGYEVLVLGTSYSASINKKGEFEIVGLPAKTEAYDLCFVGETYRYIFQEKVSVTASKTTKLETKNISSAEWRDYKFEWLGAKDKAPENAVKNQAYFNTQDGCSYIFNGTKWELLVQAGSDGKDGQNGQDGKDSSEQYVTISATDRGIRFEARILNNITQSGSYYQNNALVTFKVSREGSDVTMVRNWTNTTTDWMTCEMYYPFVEAGETYNFTFEAIQGDYILYRKNFTIEATGGLGELELTGDTDYEVELTENRVIQFTTDVTKLQASNANILEIGTFYELYADWNWIFNNEYWKNSSSSMVLDLTSDNNWKRFDSIDNSLKGHNYEIKGEVRAKIAGYQDNGQTYFTIGRKQIEGEWEPGSEITKVYIVYCSYPEEYGEYISNLPGKLGDSIVNGIKGKVAYDVVDFNSKIYEPTQTPTYKNLPDSKFNSWQIQGKYSSSSFPFDANNPMASSSENNITTIDGQKVDYYYSIMPEIVPYVKAKIMDGEQIIVDGLINLNDCINSVPGKENYVLEGLYKDADCIIPFTQGSISEILVNGADNLCLYTKWIETKTLWTGDNYHGSLHINDLADDIESDSVFYIEVYNYSSYDREIQYYMHDTNHNGSTTYSDKVTVPANGTVLLKISPSARDIAYMKQNGIYIDYNYNTMCIRSVRYTQTVCVNVNVMDGDTVHTNILLNNLSDVNTIRTSIPSKENYILEGLYTDADCTIPFTQDSISEILESGVENACLYTKWIEAKTLWEGDVWPGICIDDFADDIGSDSVFYIEVYNNSSDDIETQYFMCDQNGYGSTTYSDKVTVPANGTAFLKINPSASDIAYMKQYGIYSYNSNSSNPMCVRSVRYTPASTCVNVTVMDGDAEYAETVFTDLTNIDSITIPSKENEFLEGLYIDAECTQVLTQDYIDENLASDEKTVILYTKWIVKPGDNEEKLDYIAKNEEAFEGAYAGFEYIFPEPVDISEKSKIVIEVEFLDADKNLIEVDWGLGLTLVLPEGYSTWDDQLMAQYNLGKQDVDLTKVTDKTKKVAALAIQNSKEDVKWIIIKNISFE